MVIIMPQIKLLVPYVLKMGHKLILDKNNKFQFLGPNKKDLKVKMLSITGN